MNPGSLGDPILAASLSFSLVTKLFCFTETEVFYIQLCLLSTSSWVQSLLYVHFH